MKAIITGATGMLGEGILLECLSSPAVEKVLVINRRPGGVSHPKLQEIIHGDFFNLRPIEPQLMARRRRECDSKSPQTRCFERNPRPFDDL